MKQNEQVKDMVREKYSAIALQEKEVNLASCCGAGGCCDEAYYIMADDYANLKGYVADADLGLGCGLPTSYARIRQGDTVVDLGSGAGNDAFVARAETGVEGKVIGIDFTPAMVEKARQNALRLGFQNVEFRLGDIENMPLAAQVADVVVSNCVLNLVPNKAAVFQEIYRILRPGGHFSISDIVLRGALPAPIRQAAEMYAGCVSGAVQREEYLELIRNSGFTGIAVEKEKAIDLPDDILTRYLSSSEISDFRNSGAAIQSITIYAQKPTLEEKPCCGTGCCS